MRIFFDTEFDENGRTIELISIGLVRDDGKTYYAVSRDFDPLHCNDWVKANVLPHLPPAGDPEWKPRAQIRDEVLAFVMEGDERPEFWAYFSDYDWVVFCQLWGRMVDLPPLFPKYCLDLKQVMWAAGVSRRDLPEATGRPHHALDDARWNQSSLAFIEEYYGSAKRLGKSK